MPDRQDVEDVQLLQKAKNGEAEAFGELYERYVQSIFRFLYARLNDRGDAEDITEEVFLRVWKSLPKYREQGTPFLAYLFKVAHNALIDHYRRNKGVERIITIEENTAFDMHRNPGDIASANMEHQEIRNVLDGLREEYRTVLVLRFLSELSVDETAQVMDRSPGAVRVLQHRALSAMRNKLEAS